MLPLLSMLPFACNGKSDDSSAAGPGFANGTVVAGGIAACSLIDGAIHCWGGETPAGWTTTGMISLAGGAQWMSRVPEGAFESMDLGFASGCAVAADGSATCWTPDEYCCSGDITPPASVSFSRISVGDYYGVCGLDQEGKTHCWSGKSKGDSEAETAFAGQTMVDIAYGATTVCAVSDAGSVTCTSTVTDVPTHGHFTRVEGGGYAFCGLEDSGAVQCWGNKLASAPSGTYTDIAMSNEYFCGILTSGSIECSRLWTDAPELVPPSGSFEDISLAEHYGCAVDHAGAITCFSDGDEDWGASVPK